MKGLAAAIADGRVSPRVWLYARYDCNLSCAFCLADSSPRAPRRMLDRATMIEVAGQAAELGFGGLGITGGEPMLDPEMPELLGRLAGILPVVVNTNGFLLRGRRLDALAALAHLPVAVQLSLDHALPGPNDLLRAPGSHDVVARLVPRLLGLGLRVRIASSVEDPSSVQAAELRRFVAGLGVAPADHVVRPIVARGRAASRGAGVPVALENLPPELTVTADGAFWSPFAPTVRGERLDVDLLLTRTVLPLSVPVGALMELVSGMPPGADAMLDIR